MKKRQINNVVRFFIHLSLSNKVLLFIFCVFVFLRFYDLDNKMQFTWDQIQNSWAMKNMIVDRSFPLEGMVAKGNSGFYIGPAYYYLLAPFYVVFQLDPVAAGVFVGVVSIITFIVLYHVSKNIFSTRVALVAVAIYTVSYRAISADRTPWPVVFIPLLSLLIYYNVLEVIKGKARNIIYLALVVGFSFHFHFTSIFYPIIILLCLPLFPRTKSTFKYYLVSIPSFFVWFIPSYLAGLSNGFSSAGNLGNYVSTYYHGFHLVRVTQLLKDAFIEVEGILFFHRLRFLHYIILPAFLYLYVRNTITQHKYKLAYITLLWFIVPLFVFSLYSGEISDYYFSLTRPLVVIILAYISVELLTHRVKLVSSMVVIFWVYYTIMNIHAFLEIRTISLSSIRTAVRESIKNGIKIEFRDGDPKAYFYYLYTHKYE